jgi:GAF domain-containing protein
VINTTGQPKSSAGNSEQQLATLDQALQQLREEKEQGALIQAALNYLQAELDYSFIWLSLYDRLNHALVGQGGRCPGNSKNFLTDRVTLNSGDLTEQVVIQQRPLIVPDLRAESRAGKLAKIAQALEIQGTLFFPIRYRDICFGLVVMGSERWGILAHPGEKALLSILLGQIGATLHRLETEQQNRQTKRLDEPLLKVLGQLNALPDLQQRLEAIVAESQRFIDPTRTTVYWFESEKRLFWRRCSSRQGGGGSSDQATGDLSVSDCLQFYNILAGNHLVSVGTAQSSLSPEATSRLLEKLRLRSILAVPISFQNEFLGFLAAEGTAARVWTEDERQYLQAVAQLIALASPLDRVEQEIARSKADHALVAQVSQAIRSDLEWNQVLKQTTAQMAQHFKADRVLLLSYESEQGVFNIAFQHQEGRRKALSGLIEGLSEVDLRLLEKAEDAIAVEDLEQDIRFLAWRSFFLAAGVRSFLVARTTAQPPIEGVLVITQETARTWSPKDRELLNLLGQHMGVLLHQWHLQQQVDQQKNLYQTLQWGLTTIQQSDDLERLERLVTQSIAQILKAPLVALVTWQSGRAVGKFASLAIAHPKFTLKTETKIPVQSDVFIQQVRCTDGLLKLTVDQLTPDTRQWLGASGIEQVMAIALRTTPEDEPLGIMIVADQASHFWPERLLSLYGIFVNQLAWFRRSLLLIQRLQNSQQCLQQLNWYKHYRLIDTKRLLDASFSQLNNMVNAQQAANPIHYQQVLRQLSQVLSTLLQILRQEQWQLQSYKNTISLASFLKRSLERIDPLVKQKQLWVQIHADDTALELTTDVVKLEGILYQILVFAGSRSPEQGRIDLWCRLLDETTLDLSITDYGPIEPRLLLELQQGRPTDALAPSALDLLPGLPLSLCQKLLAEMGGSLEFYQLEDGRIMSRLVLPFVTPKR